MSYILYDPDEYETIVESSGTSCGISSRRLPPEEIAKIKATRQREHEDKILAEAALIKLKRGLA